MCLLFFNRLLRQGVLNREKTAAEFNPGMQVEHVQIATEGTIFAASTSSLKMDLGND